MLGLIVAGHTYERFPDFAEGKLAKVRSAVVNARVLAEVAGRLGIGEVTLLGRGEEGSGGRAKASILADAFEAVLGAVYLDAGWEASRHLVLRELGEAIERAGQEPDDFDHEPATGEGGARRGGDAPLHRGGVRAGPRPDLRGRGVLDGTLRGAGEGVREDAEQAAALAAWEDLTGA